MRSNHAVRSPQYAVRILARTTGAGSKNEAKIELKMKKTGEKE